MIQPATLDFLTALAAHNHKEWFDENRKSYQAARENVIEFIDRLIEEMIVFDPNLQGLEAKRCMFRINRDVRFSKDKSPYKTNLGASIARGGRRSDFAGYYLHIQPGHHMIAGGYHMPPGPQLKRLRAYIDRNTPALREIIQAPAFVEHFGTINGAELKTAPKGYAKDHPAIDLLRKKSFTVVSAPDDLTVTSEAFFPLVLRHFEAMKPFLDYLNTAIAE